MIKTSCQWCVFQKDGDCEMGLFPVLKEKELLDLTHSFPVVNGVCLYHKREDWLEGREDPVQDNLDEPKNPITFIILYSELDKLKTTLDSLPNCHVVVALEYNTDTEIQPIFNMLRDSHLSSYNIVGSHEENDFEHLFHEAFKRVKNGYCTLINNGFEVPDDWQTKLDRSVSYERNVVLGITPVNDINGLTVYSTVFRLLGKNREKHFFEKLIDNDGQDYIKTWDTL